jgi:hypothetical protein
MSARRVVAEVCLGYKEEISRQALEHKKFGWEREKNAPTALTGRLWAVGWTLSFMGHNDGQVRNTAADDSCL